MNSSNKIIAANDFASLELLGDCYSIWLNSKANILDDETYYSIIEVLENFGGVRGTGLNRVFVNRSDAEKAWICLMLRWS